MSSGSFQARSLRRRLLMVSINQFAGASMNRRKMASLMASTKGFVKERASTCPGLSFTIAKEAALCQGTQGPLWLTVGGGMLLGRSFFIRLCQKLEGFWNVCKGCCSCLFGIKSQLCHQFRIEEKAVVVVLAYKAIIKLCFYSWLQKNVKLVPLYLYI